jgi:hypothetical protein
MLEEPAVIAAEALLKRRARGPAEAASRPTSMTLRGMPSGRLLSKTSSPAKPTVSRISSAKSRTVMSVPVPTLMCCSSE